MWVWLESVSPSHTHQRVKHSTLAVGIEGAVVEGRYNPPGVAADAVSVYG